MRTQHKGFVLIASLLLLIVVTVLALAMFRGLGFETKVAGNTREKVRARLAAESTLQYAEWWLSQSNNSAVAIPVCSGSVKPTLTSGSVCTNSLASQVTGNDVANAPWLVGTVPASAGTSYTPPGMTINASGGVNNYYQAPSFYIQLVGGAADGAGSLYRINSFGYGGSAESVAVLESTYEVGSGISDLGSL